MMRRLCSLLPLVLIAAGCRPATLQLSGQVTGVEWRLVEIDGTPAVRSADGMGRDAFLQLDADSARVTGFTTCNRFFGRYEPPSAGRLRFSDIGSTKMACVEPARVQQEQQFMDVLRTTDRYEVAGNRLTLYAGNRVRARFTAAR
jgi:heat shock protein HslJ